MSQHNSDSESENSNAQIPNIDGFSDGSEAGSEAENDNHGDQHDFYMPLSDQPDKLSDSDDEDYLSSPGDVVIEQFEAESDVKFVVESSKIEDELKELKKLKAEERIEELNKKALAEFDRKYYEEVENSIAGTILPQKLLDPLPKDTTDDIKEVMNSINLSYVPEWAKEIVEDEWLGPLIEQIMNLEATENGSNSTRIVPSLLAEDPPSNNNNTNNNQTSE